MEEPLKSHKRKESRQILFDFGYEESSSKVIENMKIQMESMEQIISVQNQEIKSLKKQLELSKSKQGKYNANTIVTFDLD